MPENIIIFNENEEENINYTYQSLIDFHVEELKSEGTSEQNIKNRITALNKFLETQNKSPEDFIGDELTSNINIAIDSHLDESSITDKKGRRYHIKAWKKSYDSLLLQLSLPDTFSETLKFLKSKSGLSYREIKEKTGIKRGTIEK